MEYEMCLVNYFQKREYEKGRKSNLTKKRLQKLYFSQAAKADIISDKYASLIIMRIAFYFCGLLIQNN